MDGYANAIGEVLIGVSDTAYISWVGGTLRADKPPPSCHADRLDSSARMVLMCKNYIVMRTFFR